MRAGPNPCPAFLNQTELESDRNPVSCEDWVGNLSPQRMSSAQGGKKIHLCREGGPAAPSLSHALAFRFLERSGSCTVAGAVQPRSGMFSPHILALPTTPLSLRPSPFPDGVHAIQPALPLLGVVVKYRLLLASPLHETPSLRRLGAVSRSYPTVSLATGTQ